MMHYDVIEVQPLDHLHLSVKFRDGLNGEVIFKKSHLNGVFEALKNPDIFSKVTCENGFVEWPGDIDLAPDAMYEEVKKSGVWKLF
jgi:hypothetical protein